MRQTKHNGGGQSKMKRAQNTKIEPITSSIKNSDNNLNKKTPNSKIKREGVKNYGKE